MTSLTSASISILRCRALASTSLAALLSVAALPGLAYAQGALPTGGTVAAGAASIATGANAVTINQTSDRAIINWQGFSVGQGNSATFVQPNAQSATLNRVTGGATSVIAGQISSNGAVYLVNPNGIAITASGSVQTAGGFIASTLDIADSDFLAGKLKFTGKGGSAAVSNAGSIAAGSGAYVALLGGSVSNSGTISVPLGKVGLGAGESVALDLEGNGFMQVAVPSTLLSGSGALIDMSGTITVVGGRAELRAATIKDAVRNLVNVPGTINADSATGDGGSIVLFSQGGALSASGSLSARATGASGKGGSIETSGESVDFTGLKVNTSAAHGATGNWLVDPTDLTVDAASAATIAGNLATTNVTLTTNADGTTSGTGVTSSGLGDITVNSAIGWTSGNTLTLSAYHDVIVNAAITGSGTGASFVAHADNTGTGAGTVRFGASGSANLAGTASIYYNPATFGSATDYSAKVTAGTRNAYMLVNNLANLQAINNNLAGSYALGRDIDASSTSTSNNGAGFTPLGNGSTPFTGLFDGLNHTITGLTINLPYNSTNVGLFGYSQGAISNVGLVGGSVTGGGNLGALVGYNAGTINNAYASSAVANSTSGNYSYNTLNVGGLVGYNSGAISNSHAGGSVANNYNSSSVGYYYAGQLNIGGLVGNNAGSITNSYATGNVYNSSSVNYYYYNSQYVGGLAGYNTGSINNSHASGAVSSSYGSGYYYNRQYTGGLVGYSAGGSISNAFATGAVAGYNYTGGLIGYNTGTSVSDAYASGNVTGYSYAGGLIGYATSGTVNNSYATGAVSGVNYVGGLLGWNNIAVTTSYAAGSVSGSSYVGGLVGVNVGPVSNSYATGSVTASYGAGGLLGYNGQTITNTYSVGAVSAGNGAGGLIGVNSGGTVTSSYWNTQTSGRSTSSGGTGLTTAQMQDLSSFGTTYAGWSFSSIWAPPNQVGQNGGSTTAYYPTLYALSNVAYVAASGGTLTYGNTPTSGITYNVYGLHSGDSVASVTLGANVSSTSNVGTYDATLSNIALNTPSGSTYRTVISGATTVTARPLTVTYTANAASSIYGNTLSGLSGTVSANALVNGDTLSGSASWSTSATGASNVGSYAVTGSGVSASSNYAVTAVQAAGNATALTVNPRSLVVTYTANAATSTYGDTPIGLSGTISGDNLVNGDTLSGGSWNTSATGTNNVGSYAINGSGASASSNYAVTNVQAAGNATALSINPRALVVTYTANAATSTYGDTPTGLSGTISGDNLVNGDTLSGSIWNTSATGASNVGSYAINGSGAAAGGNYTITNTLQAAANASALTINPRALVVTYTAHAATSTYGDTPTGLSGTVSGDNLVNGDRLAGGFWTTSATGTSNVGSYAVTGSGVSASSNYAVTTVQAAGNATALTVNPRSLVVTYTANAAASTYGDTPTGLSGTISGDNLVNGDTLSGGSWNTSATGTNNVGRYAINGSGASASSNYAVTNVQAAGNATALTVHPRALVVTYTANAATSTYGNAPTGLSGAVSGNNLVNGDTLSGASWTTSATGASNVGNYAISGAGARVTGNYTVTATVQAAGNATALAITPRALSVTANALSRDYGAPNPALTYTTGGQGLVNGDALTGALATTATQSSPSGQYAITQGTLAPNANYTVTYNGSSLLVGLPPMQTLNQTPTQDFAVIPAGQKTSSCSPRAVSAGLSANGQAQVAGTGGGGC